MSEAVNQSPMIFIKTKRDTYIFNPKATYYNYGSWRINKELEVASCEACEINIKPTCVESIFSSQVVDYYVDRDNIVISPEEYERMKNSLEKDSEYNNHYIHNLKFPTLEQEFEYRLFRDKWKEVKKLVKTYIEIPFVIKNEVVSEFKEIVPLATYGIDFTDVTCRLNIGPKTALDIAIEEINKQNSNTFIVHAEYGKRPDGYAYCIAECSHSGIHYYKINGEYAFTDGPNKFENAHTFNGAYSECVTERRKYIDVVKKVLEEFVFRKENKKLSEYERNEVISKIEDIIVSLSKVDSVKKTTMQLYSARNGLNKLLDYVKSKK